MATEASLRFQIQGSAATPYKLIAEGIGTAFQMFCSCPAGRKALMMCKHVSALLMGDVSALVHPSDDVVELARWAHGSDTLRHAFHHQPVASRATIALDAPLEEGLGAAFASLIAEAEVAGWAVRTTFNQVGLHSLSKLGKVRKHPTLALSVTDTLVRPFYVLAPGNVGRSFGSVERAGAYLAEVLKRFQP